MAKIIWILFFWTLEIIAEVPSKALQESCLACHAQTQIPDALIYRRYLMTYSSTPQIQQAMFEYLKNPKVENSIMPSQFFLKFPMKAPLKEQNERHLKKDIGAFLDYFDVKQRLIIE